MEVQGQERHDEREAREPDEAGRGDDVNVPPPAHAQPLVIEGSSQRVGRSAR